MNYELFGCAVIRAPSCGCALQGVIQIETLPGFTDSIHIYRYIERKSVDLHYKNPIR
jgi:hypothetical protein